MQHSTPHHLLNTSWTLHRLSPLHHGKEFQSVVDNPTALKTYATRLRDQLTGDVLAGLQQPAAAGAEDDDGTSKMGALKTCTWESIGMSLINNRDEDGDEDENERGDNGILIVLEYENAIYKAVMLPGLKPTSTSGNATTPTTTSEREGSTHLPLLMTRLPTGLRQTVISFLSSSFDTYCTALRLPMAFMCTGLETYADAFLSRGEDEDDNDNDNDGSGEGSDSLQSAVKDMHLTLSFSKSIAPALKALNITVPRASFDEFLRGSGGSPTSKAFLLNISRYIEKHLSLKLDLSPPGPGGPGSAAAQTAKHVRLSKIACGGFVLGSEGRIKLVATGPDDTSRSRDDEDSQTRSVRERFELRGCEALLKAVMRRVGSASTSTGGQMR